MRESGDRVIGRSGDRNKIAGIAVVAGIARNRLKWLGRLGTSWYRDVLRIVRDTLREIFDENAYERFLLRTQNPRSVESYRLFLEEREAGIVRKPRCC